MNRRKRALAMARHCEEPDAPPERYRRDEPEITLHAMERYRERIDRTATFEQARAAIAAGLASGKRLHDQAGHRAFYGVAGEKPFRFVLCRRPEARPGVITVLPWDGVNEHCEELPESES